MIAYLRAAWRWVVGRFNRRPAPLPPPPPAHIPADVVSVAGALEARVAVHEAAHAVAAWYCTAVVEVTSAVVDLEPPGKSRVQFRVVQDATFCRMVIDLAGVASEATTLGQCFSKSSEADLVDARALVAQLKVVPDWAAGVRGPSLPFERMFESPCAPREVEALAAAYRVARALLVARDQQHAELVAALVRRKSLSASDLAEVLGPRPPAGLLSAAKYTFIGVQGEERQGDV